MKLQRILQTNAVTLGRLLTPGGEELCKTLELPWRDNARSISCIPAGQYTARRRLSNEHNCEVFEITNVPNRSNIEIHHGNTVKDTEGCILVGMRHDDLIGIKAVMDSDVAFAKLMGFLRNVDIVPLEVIDLAPAMRATA